MADCNTGCSEQNMGKHSVNLICFTISFSLPTVVLCTVLHVLWRNCSWIYASWRWC